MRFSLPFATLSSFWFLLLTFPAPSLAVTSDNIDNIDVDQFLDQFVRGMESGVVTGSSNNNACIETMSELYSSETVHCFLDSCVKGPNDVCTKLLKSFQGLWNSPKFHVTDVTAYKGHQWIQIDWAWSAVDLVGERVVLPGTCMGVLDPDSDIMVNTMMCGVTEYGQETLVGMLALQSRMMENGEL